MPDFKNKSICFAALDSFGKKYQGPLDVPGNSNTLKRRFEDIPLEAGGEEKV